MATQVDLDATAPVTKSKDSLRLTTQAQNNVISFCRGLLTQHKGNEEMQNKMNAIDVAYTRYKASKQRSTDGKDTMPDCADEACGNVFSDDDVTPPIVVSQVDSYVAYLADVYLSGSPIFPVVSNPTNMKYAEQLEVLMDDHASLGGYVRQLLLFLRDGVKYNYAACEVDWDSIDQFAIAADFANGTGQKMTKVNKSFTRIRRLNMRNVIRDMNVPIGDIAQKGDYAGYVEMVSRTKLKRELNKLTAIGQVYNAERAMNSGSPNTVNATSDFREDPQVSDYIATNASTRAGVDWDVWFQDAPGGRKSRNASGMRWGQMYERLVVYARIMPTDFAIGAPQPNTPQIWKFVVINGQFVISARRVVTAYDYLPILFGQPLEDGMGDQTQSVAEGEIPFQKAAATLFNIRFASARRAVSDRGLYRSDMVSPKAINAKGAAAKIPVTISALSNLKLADAYYQIPFNGAGMETVMQDAQMMVNFSNQLHGTNNPRQGQFQKGNKSVKEWDDTMSGSDGRMRLPALTLEHQFFAPLKSIMVLNIFQNGEDVAIVSQKTGETVDIKIDELRKQVLAFKVADGYTPKSKLASTEMLTQGLTLISTSQVLQEAYGASLPKLFAHMMSLGGVRDLEQYDPNYKPTPTTMPGNLPEQQLQAAPGVVAPAAPVAALPSTTP